MLFDLREVEKLVVLRDGRDPPLVDERAELELHVKQAKLAHDKVEHFAATTAATTTIAAAVVAVVAAVARVFGFGLWLLLLLLLGLFRRRLLLLLLLPCRGFVRVLQILLDAGARDEELPKVKSCGRRRRGGKERGENRF